MAVLFDLHLHTLAEKGSTVFRPVATARSRAPTATPSQSSPTYPDSTATSEITPAFSSTISLPIPSTAVPGREQPKQVVPPRPEPAHIIPQPLQNVVQENHFPNQGMGFSREASTSQSAHVLVTPSSFPPTFLTVGPSMTEPLNAINIPTRQLSRPPGNTGHLYHGLPVGQPGPSHHDPTSLAPSGSAPTEITNTLIPTPSFALPQHPPAPSLVPQSQVQGQAGEKSRLKRKSSRTRSDGEPDDGPSTRGPMSRSTTPHQRRSRGPSLPPFDPNADPGEDIDPTMVTMAALCSDTGHGRVSSKAAEILSNHAAWKARNKERRARMRVAMEAKKYGRTADDEGEDRPSNPSTERETQGFNNASSSAGPSTLVADPETGIDYSQQLQTSRYNVQVRIGANGETVIDEDSLVVDRTENEDTSNYTHVVESDHTKFVNSGTYGKRYRGSRWSAEETELFYNVSQLLRVYFLKTEGSAGPFTIWRKL